MDVGISDVCKSYQRSDDYRRSLRLELFGLEDGFDDQEAGEGTDERPPPDKNIPNPWSRTAAVS